MSSDNLLMKKQQIDPFSASFSSLLVIVFSKSNSKNFPLALNTEESPDDLQINHQIRVEAHLVA